MKKKEGRAWDYIHTFEHPFPYLYDNMTDWPDYQGMSTSQLNPQFRHTTIITTIHKRGILPITSDRQKRRKLPEGMVLATAHQGERVRL